MATTGITIHPAAALFPMLSDEEITELGESIRMHGLREKIQAIAVVDTDKTDWLVIDGRNRLEAIRRVLKLDDATIIADYMTSVKLQGTTVEQYIVMANIERRNLTQPQRKELAGKLAIMIEEAQKDKEKDEKVDSLATAARQAGVSRRTAADAKAKITKKPKVVKPPAPPSPAITLAGLDSILERFKKNGGVKYLQSWKVTDLKEAHKRASAIVGVLELLPGVAPVKKD